MQRVLTRARRDALVAAAGLVAAAAAATCSCSGSDTGPGMGAADAGTGGAGAAATTTSTSTSTASSSSTGAGGGDWLHDTALWQPIAEAIPCDPHVAALPSPKVPRRDWQPCGDGCTWAPAALEGQAAVTTVVATEIGGGIYYRITGGIKPEGEEAITVDEVARLSDDEPQNMVRYVGSCMTLAGFNSPLLFVSWPLSSADDPQPQAYAGLAAAPGAPVVWALPGFDKPSSGTTLFSFGEGWGLIGNAATVEVATTAGSSSLETAFSSPGYALHPFGRGGQLVWSDWSAYDWQTHRARIRSWTKAGGTTELAGGPYDVMYVALSDTKMVWIGGYGLGSVEGDTESEQLFWSPRATVPGDVVTHDGPLVPDTEFSTMHLVTYGDWVATITNHYQVHNVLVVNLATEQIWSIPSRPGWRFGEVMAINGTSLLVDERDPVDTQFPANIVRLELAELEALAGGLQ